MLVPCCRSTESGKVNHGVFSFFFSRDPYLFLALPTAFAAGAVGNSHHGVKQEDGQPS